MPLQNYINHISLIVDKSSSMQGQPVVKVFDAELEHLKQRSIELNQETRISIYLFADRTECLTFDMDVMRFKSLEGYYKPYGNTALLDAVLKSTEDNQKLPDLYGDNAFLQYVITDGQENSSKYGAMQKLQNTLSALPNNWTTACLVPDSRGVHEAKKFGFDADSIAVWDTAGKNALEKVGKQFSAVVDNYMDMRSKGIRGTKSLFTIDTSNLNPSTLTAVPKTAYQIVPVEREGYIREYLEWKMGQKYKIGSAYYQPTKKVEIQDHKQILVQNIHTGQVYYGSNIRQLLGLPASTADVEPGSHKSWRIFVQSTSVNRKLFPGTFVYVSR